MPDAATPQKQTDAQRQLHTSRQIEAAKGGVVAITLLNSGSWLALLTQVDKMAKIGAPEKAGIVLTAWGIGALLGTLPWFFIYLNTLLLEKSEASPALRRYQWGLDATIAAGSISALASLLCFVWGLLAARSVLMVLA